MALGKKLDSLLENYFGATETELQKDQLLEIEMEKVIVSPYQPRTHFDQDSLKALAQNISEHGLLQPVTVIDLENGSFQLISGERRYRAFKILQKSFIPAVVKSKSSLSDKQQATLGIFENLHRENLSPMDTAKAFVSLKEMHGWDNQDLANFLSCSKQHIDNYFRLFNLAPDIQQALVENKLTEGHARLMHNLEAEAQKQVLAEIISKNLTVKATQKYIDSLFKVRSRSLKPQTPQTRELVQNWQTKFPGLKISLNGSTKRGSLILKWTKEEDFPQL